MATERRTAEQLIEALDIRAAGNGCHGSLELSEQPDICTRTENLAPDGWCDYCLMGEAVRCLREQEQRWEAAKLRAYRAARVLEPSMEGYGGAMSAYIAAFGEPGDDGAVVAPDGTSVSVESLHVDFARQRALRERP